MIAKRISTMPTLQYIYNIQYIAGLGINPVRVYRSAYHGYLVKITLQTGFELSCSWAVLSYYGPTPNKSKKFDFYEKSSNWPRGIGSQRCSTAKAVSSK
jgi:hypothetical protein